MGIFMLGASVGAFVTYVKNQRLIRECCEALEMARSAPAEPELHPGMKALIVGHDPEMISVFSHLFREKRIEAQKCLLESAALHQLSSAKFEAIVLDFDGVADCPNILAKLPRPNERVLVIAVASSSGNKEAATRAGATFVIERPLIPAQIRDLLRLAYGRLLRDGQQYFRLAIELPVSIRDGSGTVRQCTTLNSSQTGMAVRGSSSFIVGESVTLAFAIPNTDIVVSAEGKIIWDDKHGKTGISFECVNTLAQSRYYEWLHDHFFMRLSDTAVKASEQMAHVG